MDVHSLLSFSIKNLKDYRDEELVHEFFDKIHA